MTKEHVLPQWALKLLPPTEAIKAHFNNDETGEKASFPARTINPQVSRVCAPCNTGWMSRLEKRVEPILRDSVRVGGPIRLDQDDQALVATWAVKTAFMTAFLGSGEPNWIPAEDFHRFKNTLAPLPHTSVWLARYVLPEPDKPDGSASMFGFWAKPRAGTFTLSFGELHGYWSTFTVGFLVCHVSTLVVPDGFPDFARGTTGESALLHIWPTVDRLLTYPPPFGLDESGLDTFGEFRGEASLVYRRRE